jgi:hypothetical protein
MSEETLNKLFAQAREEAPETSASEVFLWIGGAGLAAALAAFGIKLKGLIIAKPLMMMGTFFGIAGIAAIGIIAMPRADEPQAVKTIVEQPAAEHYAAPQKIEEQHIAAAPKENKPSGLVAELPLLAPVLPQFPLQSFSAPAKTAVPETAAGDSYGEFNTLNIRGAMDIVIVQGTECSVLVEGGEEKEKLVTIANKSGTLNVSGARAVKGNKEGVRVRITVVRLDDLTCEGAVSIRTEGVLSSGTLDLKADGACNLDIDASATDVNATLAGASSLIANFTAEKLQIDAKQAANIHLSGVSQSLKIGARDAAQVEAGELAAKNVVARCSDASHTEIYATDYLEVEAEGASHVTYKGTPHTIKNSIIGAAYLGRL